MLDGSGDLFKSTQQDSGGFPADLRPGRDICLQPYRLATVPSGVISTFKASQQYHAFTLNTIQEDWEIICHL